MFELNGFVLRFLYKGFDHVLVGQVVAASDRVERVEVQIVVLSHDGCRAALGRDGVAAHGIDFGDDGDVQTGIGFRRGDGGAQARRATAYEKHVVNRYVH